MKIYLILAVVWAVWGIFLMTRKEITNLDFGCLLVAAIASMLNSYLLT